MHNKIRGRQRLTPVFVSTFACPLPPFSLENVPSVTYIYHPAAFHPEQPP